MTAPAPPGGSQLRIFVLNDSHELGSRVCQALGVNASVHEEREFEDGEHKARPLENVRGCDAYVVQSLHGDKLRSANDKLCRLLFFIGALKDAAAARVTAVAPYLAYARKDRQTRLRDPITTRYVAALFEAVGTDVVMTVDVHNLAAFQNAFRCRTEHLEALPLFVGAIAPLVKGRGVTVVAPDAGATHRAHAFQQALATVLGETVGAGFSEKYRSGGELSGGLLVGEVQGKDVVIVDDMIGTGGTLNRTAAACRRQGASRVYAVATHGLFTGDAQRNLSESAFERLIVTNTVPPFRLEHGQVRDPLVILDAAPLIAQAIRQAHGGSSP